jgi:RNA polymerase sigma-70 factor (ECF subfamily)
METERLRPTTSPPCPPPAIASDESLVAASNAGDQSAFAALVDRYQRAAVATCLAVLRDRQLAEDAAQDAFVAAYRNRAALRDPAAFGGWLMSIARNRATRLARDRAKRWPAIATATSEPAAAPAPPPPPDEALLTALGRLPDHERGVVVLRYFDGHDVASIAAITGRPVGTVTKQLSRAHDRLRKALSKEEQP